MDTHTCLTCDNQTTGDQCIICNPEGYLVDKHNDRELSSKHMVGLSLLVVCNDGPNLKLRWNIINMVANDPQTLPYTLDQLAKSIIHTKVRLGRKYHNV